MRDLDRLIQILESANGAVVSEAFAADCRQAAGLLKLLRSPGVMAIALERERQISEEGWSPAHDDQHDNGEMACAAACYAWSGAGAHAFRRLYSMETRWFTPDSILAVWPWSEEWWKPKDPLRDLERGGALTAAEIDRLWRLAKHGGSDG
jgi:hypothetical protein